MVKSKNVALGYRVFCFIFTLSGLLTQLEVMSGNIQGKQLMYYTIQSNILALILFGLLSYKTFTDIRKTGDAKGVGSMGGAGYYTRFEMVCVVDLLLTLVVFWALLAPTMFTMGSGMNLWSFANLALHLFVPLMCLADYLLFGKRGQLKYCDVYYVLIYPYFYLLFTTTAGLSGYVYRVSADGAPVHFPYFFIDWSQMGAKCIIYILILTVFFLAISHAFYWADRKDAKNAVGRSSNAEDSLG
jgi:hypothetical protein